MGNNIGNNKCQSETTWSGKGRETGISLYCRHRNIFIENEEKDPYIMGILQYLNNIWNNYPIEFIAFIMTTLYSLLRVANDHLPVHLKLNKRYRFNRTVISAVSAVQVLILSQSKIEPDRLMDIFNPYFNEDRKIQRRDKGYLAFKSLVTGNPYTVQLGEADDPNKSAITIESSNAFKIGKLGRIKGLKDSIDEIQEIIDLFARIHDRTPKIITTIHFKLKTREKQEKKPEIKVFFEGHNFSYNCTNKIIKIVNTGVAKIDTSIKNAFYNWLEVYL